MIAAPIRTTTREMAISIRRAQRILIVTNLVSLSIPQYNAGISVLLIQSPTACASILLWNVAPVLPESDVRLQ